MEVTAIGSQSPLSFPSSLCKAKVSSGLPICNVKIKSNRRLEVVCRGMLATRKFMQRKKKEEVFKDAADEAEQKNWRRMMREIEESGSAVSILKTQRSKKEPLPRDVVLGTLVRFKQLKKWNIVSEILEWLRTQHWWDFSEMDFLMLVTAYGKLGDFRRAERVLKYMNNKGRQPSVISQTALMEAYGRAKQYGKAEAVFHRMQTSGPEPSPVTYQIILKSLVEGDKYKEAEAIFEDLLSEKRASFKPDQKMFHMMIYMYKKAGDYAQARKLVAQMSERRIPLSTVTFNSLMSFETDYKEVSSIYDQMQRAGLKPDVVSYSLLIKAYGKSRREEEALAVFEEMLDAGVRPTRKSYNILLDAFAISGLVEEANTVFKAMRRHRVEPDLCSYTTLILAYVNASNMDGAEKFFRRIKEDGLKPNVVVYGTLMKGYSKLNNVEKVMRVYERMRIQGVEPNQTIYTTIMDVHGRNSDFGNAVIWFKEMETRGYPPDQKAKNILLSLAKTQEEEQEANELVGNDVIQLEVKPGDEEVDGADEHEDRQTDAGIHRSLDNTSSRSDLNGRIRAGNYAFDEEEDNDDDDYEDEDDEEFNFVSFKDKRELNFAS
ncbi:pentatricopeptide repeat-containing protein At3g59040-like [Phragmites australis]|uniref:pentatricopeptide repeat-containing protein At3g59040-like n=1 Tax=Phragmites australis TaxID=29695 RepID=UPI002D796C46|nr:pentatricopeptide repeat-containing protein At3g59040-like [Phragmites australis]